MDLLILLNSIIEENIFLMSSFVVFLIGFLTSYDDLTIGKIKNKYILYGLATAVIFNIYYLFHGPLYLKSVLLNSFIGLATGFFFYVAGIWTAADGKLFFVYSCLVPLSIYKLGYVNYFPSFVLLLNTFLPVFFFLFFNLLLRTSWKEKMHVLKGIFRPKFLFLLFLILFSFQWLFPLVFKILHIPADFSILMIFMVFATIGIMFYIRKYLFHFAISFALIRVIFDFQSILHISFWLAFLKVFIFALFLIQFLFTLAQLKFSIHTDIEKLKPGDKSAQMIIKKGKDYVAETLPPFFARFSEGKKDILIKSSVRLTKEDIEKLKALKKEGRLKFKHLLVEETIPFAPFLFLGVLLTYFVRGSIVIYLKLLFYKNIVR
ncbi:MAG: hypothetical protein J7J92_00230 [Candidatus Aenigmarchaeota archaeon]|nr:hypothetical protein [Candidatus Aenigmarchaeota archaeon]